MNVSGHAVSHFSFIKTIQNYASIRKISLNNQIIAGHSGNKCVKEWVNFFSASQTSDTIEIVRPVRVILAWKVAIAPMYL